MSGIFGGSPFLGSDDGVFGGASGLETAPHLIAMVFALIILVYGAYRYFTDDKTEEKLLTATVAIAGFVVGSYALTALRG
jgi:ABC-type Co2+ transport system permease subunit